MANVYFVLLLACFGGLISPSAAYGQLDTAHRSEVFGREQPYRIFLPSNYHSSNQRFPVVYYFHGNKDSHEFDLEGVAELVKSNSVILVALNGRSEPNDLRPYNVGFHSNVVYDMQFKDYFYELVNHIDGNYRTMADRSKRAVIGQSMGGFMAFYLAGKFPDMVGAAVSSKGSPEFFVGSPDNHTLYSMRYLFGNLYGVKLRFHSSTECELFYLNNEVHQGALREPGLDYEFQLYEGTHEIKPNEFKDAFDFVIRSFDAPITMPVRWHHADLYADFSVWGYEVKSDHQTSGFVLLRGVTQGGLEVATRKWMPFGPEIPDVSAITVVTAGRYKPNTIYQVMYAGDGDKRQEECRSDGEGRLRLSVVQTPCQIGIYEVGGRPEIVATGYRVNGEGSFLADGLPCELGLEVLNRGGSDVKGLKMILRTNDESVVVLDSVSGIDGVGQGERMWSPTVFRVVFDGVPPTDGALSSIKFNLHMEDEKGQEWEEEFDVPVRYNVVAFDNIGVDDGDSGIFGHGNGNNIAEPGEEIMVYQGSHRLRLYYDDPYVVDARQYVELQPDKWGDGYYASSVVTIAENCPVGHQIRFLACYEEKEWKNIKRNLFWGAFTLTVGKPD